MTFNQIKESETLLKDETGCPWIVGYLDGSQQSYDATFADEVFADEIVEGIDNWAYYQYTTGTKFRAGLNQYSYNVYVKQKDLYAIGNAYHTIKYSFNENGAMDTLHGTSGKYEMPDDNRPITATKFVGVTTFTTYWESYFPTLKSQIGNYVNIKSSSEVNDFLNQNNKLLYDSSASKYYKVNIVNDGLLLEQTPITAGNMFNTMQQAINATEGVSGNANNQSFVLNTYCQAYTIMLEEMPNIGYSVNIGSDRYHLSDAPYDMFCIPFSDDLKIYKNGVLDITASKNVAYKAANALALKYSGDSAKFLYDLQLLPYCPVRYCIQSDGTFDIGDSNVTYIKNSVNKQNVGMILFARTSSFTLNIQSEITIQDKKIESETDMYRLCSPNYSGIFEFNAAKNGGMNYVNVDCTYKPYNPYIHANPNFKELYGQDFNDSRGLIVGGDFSLPLISSAWESYQLSNKNFLQAFDRQITNMTYKNNAQIEQMQWQAGAGAISAGVSGAMTGAMVGGGIGAAIGGIIGAGASALAGIKDIEIQRGLNAEAIDYTRDQFGYQMGNIKALPNGLAKVSAYTYNNKYFLFIEKYSCTLQEKQALKDKIKYNGMTVMRIGTINEFIRPEPSYIKGKLIRLENISDDFHMLNEIANEINKGVFI